VGCYLVLLTFSFQSFFAFELLKLPLLHQLHTLSIREISLVELTEVLLLALHDSELLLLEDFHTCELEGLPAEDREDGLDLLVKLENFVVLHEGLLVDAPLHRDVEGGLLPLDDKLSLVTDFIVRRLICQLLYELVRLDVDVLPSTYWLRGADVPLEKFLRGAHIVLSVSLGLAWRFL
jgi:hypothetical protein